MELTWLSAAIILYLLIGLFIAIVQDTKINDGGKRILATWATIVLLPRTITKNVLIQNKRPTKR